MRCGIGGRRGLDPVLLWLWHRLEAVALIRPLAWKPPYAVGVALKKQKKKKKKKKKILVNSPLSSFTPYSLPIPPVQKQKKWFTSLYIPLNLFLSPLY